MATRRITLTIEGMKKRGGNILASDFLHEIQFLLGILKETERSISFKRTPTLCFEIVGLSHSSPAQVIIQPSSISREVDYSDSVINQFFLNVERIDSSNEDLNYLSPEIIQSLIGMVKPIGKTLSSVFVTSDERKFIFHPSIMKRAEQVVGSEQEYPGAIRGVLEALNLHRDANVFRIYPDYGPSKLNCFFAEDIEQDVLKAIGHFVEVRGILVYNSKAQYPHEIRVDNLKIFPDEKLLPSLSELRGIAPDATGELASEDFVRKIRNASV